jgi:hypothetical protein
MTVRDGRTEVVSGPMSALRSMAIRVEGFVSLLVTVPDGTTKQIAGEPIDINQSGPRTHLAFQAAKVAPWISEETARMQQEAWDTCMRLAQFYRV